MEKVNIDFVIISNAKDKILSNITKKCIESILSSEERSYYNFNIVIIESNKDHEPYKYPNTLTLFPKEKFGYHRYLNIGLKQTSSEYVCLCNNDLIFHKNWLSEILKVATLRKDIMTFSSLDPWLHQQYKDLDLSKPYIEGYDKMKVFTGWFFVIRRNIIDIVGLFDENLEFWFCDDDFINVLKKYSIKHALVTKSVVKHLGSKTLNGIKDNQELYSELTSKQYLYYDYKWNHQSKFKFVLKVIRYYFHHFKLKLSSKLN